jgi:hypothetical protein
MKLIDAQTSQRLGALMKVGFVTALDVIFALAVLVAAVLAVIYGLKSQWSGLIICVALVVTHGGTWLMMIAYRCLYQILQARAEINLAPEANWRYLQGVGREPVGSSAATTPAAATRRS